MSVLDYREEDKDALQHPESENSPMRRIPLLAVVTGLLFAMASGPAHAAPVTFAQFVTDASITQNFQLVNDGSSATLSIVPGKAAVEFQFQNILGLPTTQIHATLTFSTTTTIPVISSAGFLIQTFQTGSFQFVGSGNAGALAQFNGKNLLSATLLGGRITGPTNATGGNYIATQDSFDTVNFTSDYLNFTSPQVHSQTASLSFSSLDPMLAQVGNFLRNFAATGTGTFSSDPPPIIPIIPQSVVPEPATLAMSMIGAVAGLITLRRRRRV